MTNRVTTAEQVRSEIKNLIAVVTERDAEEVSDTALFVDDLGVDSLMAMEVMVTVDKKFKIDIPEEEFSQIKNVNDAVATVMRYLSQDGMGQAAV
jgi:acyl carrier protein